MLASRPVLRGDKCVLEFADLYFEVTPAVAGRITSLCLGGLEVLSPASVHATNYGSTFWTSPQCDWSWPPPTEIDSAAYLANADQISCTLVGPPVHAENKPLIDGLRVSKTFTADLERHAISAAYTITNESHAEKRVAPWEITRVPGGGLTFYGADSAPSASAMFPLSPAVAGAGAYWFQHSPSMGETKLLSDGKGWIAHLTRDDVLLIKAFSGVPAGRAAPGEAEIEIYSAPAVRGGYVEVENQGPLADLAPSASMTWTVHWYVRKLPAGIMATLGNADLVTFVTRTIQ